MAEFKLRLRNAAQIVTVCAAGERLKVGAEQMGQVAVIENGTIIVNNSGLIEAVGRASDLEKEFAGAVFETDIDVSGKVVLPGFVDAHTHPVWSGDRVHEFAMKVAGVPYMEIHKKGGGIGFTVSRTRASSAEELQTLLNMRLDRMLGFGTTVVEAKSGYGLDVDTEMKMLRVLHDTKHPVRLISTYLGAHSVPQGSTAEAQTNEILHHHFPRIKELSAAGEISPSLCDVFCEKGVFDVEQTERILRAGASLGLRANFHGEELTQLGGGELCERVRAIAMSHCEMVSEAGMEAMARVQTVAVLLPSTSHLLRIPHAPARALIEHGVPVALATDFNPNAHCLSMPWVMHHACILLKMSLPEALNAATINAAASVGVSDMHGSLEVGKAGDCVLLDAPQWEHVIYQFEPPIYATYIGGRRVYGRE